MSRRGNRIATYRDPSTCQSPKCMRAAKPWRPTLSDVGRRLYPTRVVVPGAFRTGTDRLAVVPPGIGRANTTHPSSTRCGLPLELPAFTVGPLQEAGLRLRTLTSSML